jgi:UV DNA damage endonuclease
LPLYTHPEYGYRLEDLNNYSDVQRVLGECCRYSEKHQIRLTFHPDQFIVLNSAREEVVESSISELEYQAKVAELIGADVINIHLGGVYGDRSASVLRLKRNMKRLSVRVRRRLTFENDDRSYTAEDVLRFCADTGYPMVYDVHHHRCLPDDLSVLETTERAIETWDREPLFHVSSPIEGWKGTRPERHHDYIDLDDFPKEWLNRELTVEVEAKAKETAVKKLTRDLGSELSYTDAMR